MSTPEVAFAVGMIVKFKGYSPDAEGNLPEPAILQVGEKVRIDREQNDGSFVVYSLDRKNAEDAAIGDAAFPEEIEHTGDPADLEVGKKKAAAAAKPAKAPKASKAKAGDKSDASKENADVGLADNANATVPSTDKPKSTKAKGTKVAEAKTVDQSTTETVTEADENFEALQEELAAQQGRPNTTSEGEGASETEGTGAPQALPGGVVPQVDTTSAPVIQITDSDAVKKILSESKDVIAAAKALAKRSQQNDFALGGVLNHIRDTGIWKTVTDALGNPYEGKRGFTQFIKDHLDVDYRKAMYLIKIYTIFRRLGQDEKSLDKMGWSKAKELAALGSMQNADGEEVGFQELEEHFDELAGFAATNSREDLVAEIQKRMAAATTDKVQITRFAFKLSGHAAELANNALTAAEAKVEGEDNKKNNAFEYIMADWLMHNADMSLNDVVAAIQNKYGVTLTVGHNTDHTSEDEQSEDQTASA